MSTQDVRNEIRDQLTPPDQIEQTDDRTFDMFDEDDE